MSACLSSSLFLSSSAAAADSLELLLLPTVLLLLLSLLFAASSVLIVEVLKVGDMVPSCSRVRLSENDSRSTRMSDFALLFVIITKIAVTQTMVRSWWMP